MTEVLKALQGLNVRWKKIGPYNMKCQWVPGVPGHHEGMSNNSIHNPFFGDDSTVIENGGVTIPNAVKFEVQVMNILPSVSRFHMTVKRYGIWSYDAALAFKTVLRRFCIFLHVVIYDLKVKSPTYKGLKELENPTKSMIILKVIG